MLLYLLWLPLITLLVSVNLAFVWNRSRRILTCHQVTRQWELQLELHGDSVSLYVYLSLIGVI